MVKENKNIRLAKNVYGNKNIDNQEAVDNLAKELDGTKSDNDFLAV